MSDDKRVQQVRRSVRGSAPGRPAAPGPTIIVLPDAAPTNWVDRYAPRTLRPWLKLGRFDRPTGIWLLMLPGWQGIALAGAMDGRAPDPWLMAAFLVGAALMRAAGCAYNDIVDRDIDAKVARTAARPLASRQIGLRGAWAFIAGCSLASLAILLTFNLLAVVLGDRLAGPGGLLPVHEAGHLVAAGLAGPHLQLGGAARLRGGQRRRRAADPDPRRADPRLDGQCAGPAVRPPQRGGAGALRLGDILDTRLRHDLRRAGSRGRCAGGREVLRAAARQAGAGRRCWCSTWSRWRWRQAPR